MLYINTVFVTQFFFAFFIILFFQVCLNTCSAYDIYAVPKPLIFPLFFQYIAAIVSIIATETLPPYTYLFQ